MDSPNRLVIEANFSLILRWTLIFSVVLFSLSVAVAWLVDSDSTGQRIPGDEMVILATRVFGWGILGVVGFAAFLYGITRLCAVTVTPDRIAGRNYWGIKVQFPPGSVTNVSDTTNQGVRYLWLSSSESQRRLCLPLLGVPIANYVGDLSRILGPDHELTRWFSSNS